jgi:integrase
MSLIKRGGVWWVDLVRKGKRHQQSSGHRNKNDARTFLLQFRSDLINKEHGILKPKAPKEIPGFKVAMLDFLTWSQQEHTAHPATYRRYQVSSVALLRHFKDEPLDAITPDVVEQFKAVRQQQFATARGKKDKRKQTNRKVKPATVNRELACLRAVFNHAIKADLPVKNPISKTAVKSLQENNEQTRVLSYEEEKQYLAASTPMLYDVATLILQTGMRPEEVYRIQPKNVHLNHGYLFNPFGKTKAAKRRITLTASARDVLKRRMIDCGAYLFPCDTDATRPVPKVNNAHDRAIRDSKIAPARLYDLRHTWATRAAESGIDLVTLAAMLGHSKINMVLRYVHVQQAHQTQAMHRMERYVLEQSSTDRS